MSHFPHFFVTGAGSSNGLETEESGSIWQGTDISGRECLESVGSLGSKLSHKASQKAENVVEHEITRLRGAVLSQGKPRKLQPLKKLTQKYL